LGSTAATIVVVPGVASAMDNVLTTKNNSKEKEEIKERIIILPLEPFLWFLGITTILPLHFILNYIRVLVC
jgi:hypothetical protein